MGVPRYQRLLDKDAYPANPSEPIDSWFQTSNASNACTTMAIIQELHQDDVDMLVDPLVGSGGSASTARAMGIPFFGIELDPVLACICIAKSMSAARHVAELAQLPAAVDPDHLAELLAAIEATCDQNDGLVVSCLVLTACVRALKGHPIAATTMAADLVASRGPCSDSRVICGDATASGSWDALGLPAANAVIYTSPPFGHNSPRLDVPDVVRLAAQRVLATAGLVCANGKPFRYTGYQPIAFEVLRLAAEYLSRATVIVEHEPADDGHDSCEALAAQISMELDGVVRNLRILECGAFSWRGALSMLVCEFRR